MTQFLRQQKNSAFLAGVGASAALYVSTKMHFWRVIEETAEQLPGGVPRAPAAAAAEEAKEPVLGATARAWAVRQWNEGVDSVFKPVVEALSRRNL